MIREKISELSKNMKEDHISESSAQCAYYTILSFIPFIMLVITLIQYTGVEPQTLFDVISKIIPSSMSEMILGIVQEVYSKSIGTISISVIFTIWAAGKGLYALTKGLQIVYNTDDKEETSYLYTRIKAVIETIVFIVLIVMGLTLLVFGNGIISIIKEKFGVLVSSKNEWKDIYKQNIIDIDKYEDYCYNSYNEYSEFYSFEKNLKFWEEIIRGTYES